MGGIASFQVAHKNLPLVLNRGGSPAARGGDRYKAAVL